MPWEIYPLDLGTAQLKASLLVAGPSDDPDRRIASPSIAWLLFNPESQEHILVDAGPCEDYEWGVRYHNGFYRDKTQNLSEQLAFYGLTAEDISCIVLTHLHWDHAYGVLDIPNIPVFVQRTELHYAIDPLPKDTCVYETSITSQMPFFFRFYHRMRLVDGDVSLREGLKLITLPGHTPGSQGVVVETERGPFLIAGDLVGTMENWTNRISGGIVHSAEDYQKSFKKIEEMGVQVLPSHDFRAWEILRVKKQEIC